MNHIKDHALEGLLEWCYVTRTHSNGWHIQQTERNLHFENILYQARIKEVWKSVPSYEAVDFNQMQTSEMKEEKVDFRSCIFLILLTRVMKV